MLLRNIDSLPLPSIEGKQFPTKVTADGFGHVTCFGQRNELFRGAKQRPKEDLHSPASSLVFQLLPQEGSGQASSTLAAGGRRESRGLDTSCSPQADWISGPQRCPAQPSLEQSTLIWPRLRSSADVHGAEASWIGLQHDCGHG